MNTVLWEKAVAFHGHACPGLAVGVKACEAVLRDPLFADVPYGELLCVTENDACGVDALQCLLGCSLGKGNLVYRGTAKHVYTFFNRHSGEGKRLSFSFPKTTETTKEERQTAILNAAPEDLFTISPPAFPMPEPARIFATIVCDSCGEGAAEHAIRLREGKRLCLDCHAPYDRGWR